MFLAGLFSLGAGDLRLLDLAHKPVDPFANSNASKAVVFIFISNDCPIANRYAPELERLHETYSEKDVAFWLVHADSAETPASIRQHAREFKYEIPVLRDPKHDLVRLAGASITPEVALFLPNGTLAYRGRIDNRYEDFGKMRRRATNRDLEEAIEAVLAGKLVTNKFTKAVGCRIPERK